ncbi:MAG: type I restriction enzyme HsdR N-terminal domain-containing protein [Chitinophagaceae bacterium]|nr:MAG: type I restriction enzyme HsdR N-terminal domain-containing protein [Chitinophagaceae bacterium]
MIRIEYPDRRPSIREESGVEEVFCICRKRWVRLTPEEWVRQNFLLFLSEVLGYPLKLTAVEKLVQVGELRKRFDIVVYNVNAQPRMLIECKEMNVPLSDKTIMQLLSYNSTIGAAVLVITNGSYCIAFRASGEGTMEEIETLPSYPF